jgi:hypothetical protein
VKGHFLDTSAFIKRYLNETGSDVVDSLFEEEGERYVSGLCLLETHSNIQRLHAVDDLLTAEQVRMLHAAVASDIEAGRVTVVNATAADIEEAARMLTRRYLTAVDALQVAIAKGLGPEVVFVSSDLKLNRVASEQGLTVLDPTRRSG